MEPPIIYCSVVGIVVVSILLYYGYTYWREDQRTIENLKRRLIRNDVAKKLGERLEGALVDLVVVAVANDHGVSKARASLDTRNRMISEEESLIRFLETRVRVNNGYKEVSVEIFRDDEINNYIIDRGLACLTFDEGDHNRDKLVLACYANALLYWFLDSLFEQNPPSEAAELDPRVRGIGAILRVARKERSQLEEDENDE